MVSDSRKAEHAKIKKNLAKKRAYPKYKLADRESFGVRLTKACEEAPHIIPPIHQGRNNWFVHRLSTDYDFEITREGVRKWFAGEAMPRPEIVLAIADLLGIDPGWLMFGSHGLAKKKDIRSIVSDEGAVNLIIGIVQMSGGSVAMSDDNSQADIFAIIERRQHRLFARLASDIGNGKFKVEVPNSYKGAVVIGVIQKGFGSFDLVALKSDVIDAHGTRKGPYVEVVLTKRDKGWVAGRSQLAVMDNLAADIARIAA